MWRLSNFAIDHPKVTLLIIGVITVALAPGLFRLHIDSDFEKQIPKTHEIIKSNEQYKQVFGDKKTNFIAIINEKNTIYTPETLKVVVELSKGIREIPELIESNVFSLADSKYIKGEGEFLDVKLLLDEDNIPQTQEELDEFRQAVKGNPLFYGKLVSKDDTTAVISFDVKGDYDKARAHTILHNLIQKYQTNDVKIHVTGAIVLRDIDIGVANDFAKLLPFAMLLVMVGLFFSFRTPRGVLVPILLISIANLWTVGIMGYLKFEFGPVTSIIPVLIVVIGGSYAIHSIHRFYEALAEEGVENLKATTKKAMRSMGPAVTMAAVTSAFGTLSLLTFKVSSIQIFGISGCIGTLICCLLTLTLDPAILSLLKPPRENALQRFRGGPHQGGLSTLLFRLGNFSMHRQVIVLLVVVLVIAASVVGVEMIKSGQDHIAWFPKRHEVYQAAELLNEKLGGSVAFYAMIDGGEPDALKKPQVLDSIRAFQEYAATTPDIEETSSFADVIALLNRELHESQGEYYKIPDSQDLVSQYLLLYSMSGDASDFDSLMIDYQQASVFLPAKVHDSNLVKALYKDLNNYLKTELPPPMKAALGGPSLVFAVIDEYIVKGKIENMIVTLTMVFVFCSLVFRSFIGGLLGMIPIALATLMNFGLMGFLGIRLDLASAIVTGIGVGIGVDFILHFLFRLKEEARKDSNVSNAVTTTMASEGTAIIFDAASNVLAFGVFLTSFLVPIQNFGWLVGFIMINSCLTTLCVTPALVHLLKPKFIFK